MIGPIGSRGGALAERASLGLILLAAAAARLAHGPVLREDAYITLRYASRLAAGLGFTYNPGERVLGTTTPLFTLLLAGLTGLGLETSGAAVAVGIAADVGAVVVIWALGRRLAGWSAGLVAALSYALMTPAVAYAVSGLETSLYVLLIGGSFLAAMARRPLVCAGLCALVALLRPDGLIVVFSIVGVAVLRAGRAGELRHLVHQATKPALVFLAVTLPWVLFAWRYFGSPLPQSMLAKWGLQIESSRLFGLSRFVRYFVDVDERWFLVLTPLALVGAAVYLWRPAARSLALWTLTYVAAFLATNKFLYPDYTEEWYFVPLLLPYSLAIGAGVARVGDLLRRPTAVAAAFAILLVLLSAPLLARERAELARAVGGREQLYLQLADHLRVRYGVTDAPVATPEVGAFSYRYPGPIVDLYGLVTKNAVGRPWLEILRRDQPEWIFWFDTFVPPEIAADGWLRMHYRPVLERTNWEGRRLQLLRWYPSPERLAEHGPRLGGLRLLGRTVERVETADGPIERVALTWSAGARIAERRTISVRVLGADGAQLAQQDNEPQEGSRPTTDWSPGEPVLDRFDLRLAPADAARARWLAIGAYPTGQPDAAHVWQDTAGRELGRLLYAGLAGPPAGPRCGVVLGGFAELSTLELGADGALRLEWTARAPAPADYTVFVHALGPEGRLIAQADGPPLEGRAPTSSWQPGDLVVEQRTLPLPTGVSPARLLVGLYDPRSGVRLARADGRGDAAVLRPGAAPGCE